MAAQSETSTALSLLLRSIPMALITLSSDGRVVEANGDAHALLAGGEATLVGRPVHTIIEGADGELGLLDLLDELAREAVLRPDGPASTLPREFRMLRPDGQLDLMSVTALHVPQLAHGRVLALTPSAARRTVRSEAAGGLHPDPLTGLPSRPVLMDRLRTALTRLHRSPGHVGVIFIDMDRMKAINDRLGHHAGDLFLCDVAARMRSTLRDSDTVARFGGDEFVVLIADAESELRIERIVQRLNGVIAQPMISGGEPIEATASIGVSITDDATRSAEDLIRDADAAMYESKRRREGRPVRFDASLRAAADERMQVEADLRQALMSREVLPYFQPIVSLDGRIRAAEALVRWRHPERGLLAPAAFLPLAEETGLVQDLWSIVLEDSCRAVSQWRAAPGHDGAYASVNLSPRQFGRADLVSRALGILDRTGVMTDAIQVEVTETALIADSGLAHRVLREFSEAGFRIALDDFGTGYSSLSHLREFPVTMVKIDRAFTMRLQERGRDAAIVRAIVELARALGILACAEGVETHDQAAALADMQCDLGQGYLWGRPETAADLRRRLVAA